MRSGLTEEKELSFDLSEKLTPKVDWHGWGTSVEDSDEMDLKGDVSQYSVRYEYLLWARPAKARR